VLVSAHMNECLPAPLVAFVALQHLNLFYSENPNCQICYRRLSTWDSDDGTPGYELYHDEAKVTENEEPGIITSRDVTAQKRTSRQVGVILDTRRPQCFRVVERYIVCRCLYYVHAIQRCSGLCGPDEVCRVHERTILVGYLCPQHS
jgi:hypothetical protein